MVDLRRRKEKFIRGIHAEPKAILGPQKIDGEFIFSRRVIIESPFAGKVGRNVLYARVCMRDCLNRGEAPFASHLLYTQPGILRDYDPDERAWGIAAGLAWGIHAAATVVYTDLGITPGMELGIARARKQDRPIEYRKLY